MSRITTATGQAIGNKVTISNANPGDAIEFLAFKLSEVTVESLGSGQSLIKAGQNGSELVINEDASNIYLTAATGRARRRGSCLSSDRQQRDGSQQLLRCRHGTE